MNYKILIAVFALSSISLMGCNDTAAGMAEDTKENTAAAAGATEEAADNVAKTAENMAEDVGEAAADAAATTLTARIKAALIANPITNDPDVTINVEADKDTVRLEGMTVTQGQKDEAGQIAKEILKEVSATQAFSNELKVR